MFSFSRRRTYVCEYFDYAYVVVNKEVGKDWNNRFISFIPFLCGLTLELSQQLRSICELESSSKLLFQQSVEDVCLCTPLHVCTFLCVKCACVPCRLSIVGIECGLQSKGTKSAQIFRPTSSKAQEEVSSQLFVTLDWDASHSSSVLSSFCRSLASIDRLALQESYFLNFHNLCPCFVLLCFILINRLKTVYISTLELKNDIDFFSACTVRSF